MARENAMWIVEFFWVSISVLRAMSVAIVSALVTSMIKGTLPCRLV